MWDGRKAGYSLSKTITTRIMIVYHMIISIAGKIYCFASQRERERERERELQCNKETVGTSSQLVKKGVFVIYKVTICSVYGPRSFSLKVGLFGF